MGLDMYLSAKRYMSKYSDKGDVQKIEQINEIFDVVGLDDEDYGAQEVTFRVGYWRKANAIHDWFVRECQEGRDECQETWLSREQLQKLADLCREVVADPSKAEDLLPTRSGFFFGDTAYDEWYFDNLNYTTKRINKILKDPAFERADFYYQSSW